MIVVDCNYLGHVCRHSQPIALSHNGKRTEVILSFLQQIANLPVLLGQNKFVFCWDSRHSIRKSLRAEYKSNRGQYKTDEERAAAMAAFEQFDELRTAVLPDLGFSNVVHQYGYEGDDLIASAVNCSADASNVVVSNDKDLYQLLGKCKMFNAVSKTSTTAIEFKRTWRIEPEQWAQVKAISGCTGDVVVGVPGIGDKRAAAYLRGELSGSYASKIAAAKHIIASNTRLVKLPLGGTIKVIAKRDQLTTDKYKCVCSRYGLASLLSDKAVRKWEQCVCRSMGQ